MKKFFLTVFASAAMLSANAQFPGGGFPGGGFPGGGMPGGGMGGMMGGFGFGGQQINVDDIGCSEKFTDVNYADDDQAYHTMDIYLPKNGKAPYPVMVHIYGSAWFSNSSKGAADLGTICKAYLEAGYAVVCPNHRSSGDAKWPAQCHDIKAVIRYIRANADKYKFDHTFVGSSGFSSGGHLSSVMGATSGTKKAKVGNYEIDLEGSVGKHLDQSSAVQVAVSWSGPVDMGSMDCNGRASVAGTPEEALIGVSATENPDQLASVSATSYMDKNDPPMIGFHGTADNVVPFCQAEKWTQTAQVTGIKCEFVPQEGGGHGFNMYSEENLKKMVEFVDAARKK